MGEVKSLAELLAEPPSRGDWGPWVLDAGLGVLHLADERYWIEVATCLTPAAVLDWIMQLAGKPWVDDRILAGLVRALDDLLDPQATLCSHGLSTSMSPVEVQRRVDDVATWQGPASSNDDRVPRIGARLDGQHLVVDRCPWCADRHHHGAGDPTRPAYGDRVAHCQRGHYELVPLPEAG